MTAKRKWRDFDLINSKSTNQAGTYEHYSWNLIFMLVSELLWRDPNFL